MHKELRQRWDVTQAQLDDFPATDIARLRALLFSPPPEPESVPSEGIPAGLLHVDGR